MKKAVLWGVVFGLVAFLVNVLLPGCFEPLADLVLVFLAAMIVVKPLRPIRRGRGLRLGLVTGITSGIVITLTDMLLTGLLILGYLYKDQIPGLNLPDYSFLNAILGNSLLIIIVIFLLMGAIKMVSILIGGLWGGWFFAGKAE